MVAQHGDADAERPGCGKDGRAFGNADLTSINFQDYLSHAFVRAP
jgi:hypothetical protein